MTDYTNITLLQVDQTEAADWLAENGYRAVISPMVDDITVVYDCVLQDHVDTEEPIEDLLRLASELSYELGCVAWLVIASADVLIYLLYIDGDLKDTYNDKASETEEGGDAEVLADAFGAPKRAIKDVRAALKREGLAPEARHAAIVKALEISALAVGTGYDEIKVGNMPIPAIDPDDFVWIDPDEDASE